MGLKGSPLCDVTVYIALSLQKTKKHAVFQNIWEHERFGEVWTVRFVIKKS